MQGQVGSDYILGVGLVIRSSCRIKSWPCRIEGQMCCAIYHSRRSYTLLDAADVTVRELMLSILQNKQGSIIIQALLTKLPAKIK